MKYEFNIISSPFGDIGLVWFFQGEKLKISRIFLPETETSMLEKISTSFLDVCEGSNEIVNDLSDLIVRFLNGEDIKFDFDMIDEKQATNFQLQVLKAEHMIPRTWISTYGRIAWALGKDGSARAVGNALANNPFPIIIPCHRAVRSDGALGGFQGGLDMKRRLLEMEGIQFSTNNKVNMMKIYY